MSNVRGTRSPGRSALTRLILVGLLCVTGGCEPDDGAVLVPVDGDPFIEDNTSAWLGSYEGAGTGTVSGEPVSFSDVRLTVRLDAASVRDAQCPRCVTVELDTLFALINVDPASQVSLTLGYRQDGLRRSLRMDRYSGGGGIGNVVAAKLVVDSITGGDVGDVEYIFERR